MARNYEPGVGIHFDAWDRATGLSRSAALVPAAGRWIQDLTMASDSAQVVMASHEAHGAGLVLSVLDPALQMIGSTPVSDSSVSIYSAADGNGSVAVAWRDGATLELRLTVATPDLASMRKIGIPASYANVTRVRMAWRDGGFDLFWALGVLGRIGYGRIPAVGEPTWSPDLLGRPQQRNEVMDLQTLADGRQFILYQRDSIERGAGDGQAVLGLVDYTSGKPVVSEVWVAPSFASTARMAALPYGFAISTNIEGTRYLTHLSCPPLGP